MTDVTDRAPTAGWVLYDGECSICVALARWFAATLNKRGFSLASFETPWARSRLGLGPGATVAEMKVVTRDGDSFGGADAVIYLARQIWWAWPLYAIAQVPLGTPTLRRGYRWIAARRDCRNGSCARAEWIKRPRRKVGWLPLVVLPCCGVALRSKLPPWALMWVLSVAIYAGCKWLTAWSHNDIPSTRMRRLGYLLAWPGMDAESFFDTLFRPRGPSRTDWTWAVSKTALGVALLWGVVRHVSPSLPLLRGWVGLLGLFFLLHVGTFHILALLWQTAGVCRLAHYAHARTRHFARRLLGQAMEPWFSPACCRARISPVPESLGPPRSNIRGLPHLWACSRFGDLVPRPRRIRASHRLLYAASCWPDFREVAPGQSLGPGPRRGWAAIHPDPNRWARLLLVPPLVRDQGHRPVPATDKGPMNSLVPWIWIAGAVQLSIATANLAIPTRVHYRENLRGISPIIRQLSLIHWAYVVGVVVVFSGLCFFFAPELTGASRLGRYLSGTLAVFWLARCAVQLFYYDSEVRKQNRLADAVFVLAFFFLGCVFAAATLGGPK